MQTVEQIIDNIIRVEGRYNDITEDRGGATNMGISLRYLKGVGLRRGDLDHDGDIDKDDIRIVTHDIAYELYMQDFFLAPRINTLPAELHPILVDMAVNYGPPRAIMLLQKALRNILGGPFMAADGVVGPKTRVACEDAIRKVTFPGVQNAIVAIRKAFYVAIVQEDPTQKKFLAGWINRAESFAI